MSRVFAKEPISPSSSHTTIDLDGLLGFLISPVLEVKVEIEGMF